ncbi:MAG: serine/threonine-protein kinase [Microlunatus sp.]
MGELFAGRYEFVDLLGDGGMGTVWRVWDHRDQGYRAAKVLKQSDSVSLLRFVRETSWRIDHEHVVTPLGWSAEDDRVLFTMPLVGGGTVATLLSDFGRLPPLWVHELLGQLLTALEAVHATGLVHRDVKPGNLLLDPTGTGRPHLRLTDFGIAAPVGDPRLTRAGESIGTPGYQAPEAAHGADPDPRQDLYAAGVVALELLTGRRPPISNSSRPDTSPIAGLIFAPVIERLVEPDPARRYSSATQARAALAAVRPPSSDRTAAGDIEVFGQLPELPDHWDESGPTPRSPAADAHTAEQQVIEAPADRSGRLPVWAGGLIAVGLVFIVIAALLVR